MSMSFFEPRQKPLFGLGALYIVLLILSHVLLPLSLTWHIAVFFLIAMNGTYVIEAVSLNSYARLEAMVAAGLIALALLGLFTSPILVILAILGHACWDVCKHKGCGVRFFSWYTLSCAAIDVTYASALLAYWIFF